MARIAVVGGGFGGVYAIKALCKRHTVTLFDPRDNFVFTPLLHEVAGGVLDKDDVSVPYESLFHGVKHVQAAVTRIDLKKRTLVAGGEKHHYDYIIIASGAHTKRPRGMTHIKTVEDALSIRDTITKNALAASLKARKGGERAKRRIEEKGCHLLHIVVVGGGATGVELAGECMDLVRYWTRKAHIPADIAPRVTLVHSRGSLLHNEDPFLGRLARERLERKGVAIMTEARVTDIRGNKVTIAEKKSGSTTVMESSFVIWSGGVAPNTIPPSREYHVGKTLQIAGYPHAFAIGDVSSASSSYPALAQVATMQGTHAAKMIRRLEAGKSATPFSWKDRGRLVSVGQKYAVGKIAGVPIRGFVAWFIMRTVYLLKFNSAKYELRTAVVYTKRLFTRNIAPRAPKTAR